LVYIPFAVLLFFPGGGMGFEDENDVSRDFLQKASPYTEGRF